MNKPIDYSRKISFVSQRTLKNPKEDCFVACSIMLSHYYGIKNRSSYYLNRKALRLAKSDEKQSLGQKKVLEWVSHLKFLLEAGPILGGVYHGLHSRFSYTENGKHSTMQHAIIISGWGVEKGMTYFKYIDPSTQWEHKGMSNDNKLYVLSNSISGRGVMNDWKSMYYLVEYRDNLLWKN